MSIRSVTVLISGNGSNLQALIDARKGGRLQLVQLQVISNRADAYGLERARRAGIPHSILSHESFSRRDEFDAALAGRIAELAPDLIILAGFMRILGPAVLGAFEGKIINLHPSLLPLYPGTDTYSRAIAAGDRVHGASMHFVTAELDGGPVISQVRIPIEAHDDAKSLAQRLSPREHQLVVATTELFIKNSVQCRDERVYLNGSPLDYPLILSADGRFSL